MNARTASSRWSELRRRTYLGLNYRLRTFGGGKWADRCCPTDIAFLMTNLCNARCVHCDIWKNKGKDDTPTVEQYKAVLDEIRSWLGPVHVYFTGGEALLRPYTPELLAHAAEVGLFAEILTHGYWDDQSRIEKLAMANPSRITVSLDGIGEVHTKIRGREKFFEKTTRSLETLKRLRAEHQFGYIVRLKTVIMEHNLHEVGDVARYAAENGFEIFYQAVEQNYNTPEDPRWFDSSDNWPKDSVKAVAAVREIIALKERGLPIRNSDEQLQAMIPYFLNPDSMRVSVQQHMAHLKHPICAALTTLQILPNGDVLTCYGMPSVGNIKTQPLRAIWKDRPQWWNGGCCLERRFTAAEAEKRGLVAIGQATRS